MCGIAGYLDMEAGEAERRAVLERMAAAIVHRGPDGSGVLVDGPCGLAHTRLSIVDLSTGAQPMTDSGETLAISFNGEIFNYRELRDDLIARGYVFRTTSDTEVILNLYRAMGPDCVTRLNGDFAFALWDRTERRLMLARDRIGVRPLFYARRGPLLAFASEMKCLFAVPGIEAELDLVALDQIFTTWAPIAPRTGFADIAELPPGHMLLMRSGGAPAIRRYWSLDFPRAGETPHQDERAAGEELRALLADATRIRLRADVPVGAYLSGGLDSCVVAALARAEVGEGLRTFSVTFEDAEFDESAFQQTMSRALGTRHLAIACGAGDISRAMPAVAAHGERAILRTSPAPLFLLSDAVRRDGLKVVLTGEGADEVLGGYDIFKEAKLRRFVARQPGSERRPRLLQRLYPYLPRVQSQSPQFLAAFFGASPADLADPLFSHLPRYRTTSRARMFFSAEVKRATAGYDALDELRAALPAAFAHWHPLSQAQYLETTHLLPGYILSSQGDRVAMAHGVEGRFPFLDHRVVEFAAGLHPELKLKGLAEKHILRAALKNDLPPEIAQRPKQPYRAPEAGVFFGPEADPQLGALFAPEALAAGGLFEPAAVARLAAKAHRTSSLGFAENAALVGIATAELVRRRFCGPSLTASATAPRLARSI